MISTEDYLWFVNRTLDQMTSVLHQLGDEHATEQPDLPGANSAYGIVTHCLGVMTSWGGHLVAGREVVRDRDAEFHATGTVADLVAKIDGARSQFVSDVEALHADDPLHFSLPLPDGSYPYGQRQGAALVHIFEELAQHLGQMEISRDVLLAEA
jgi:hypothetical protein